ncbi:LemA family protein [Candidatus Wolfebacteria bacterium]|nr:LemA family protein [Candidatus Wolfebacteria bacterium]
MNYLNLQNIIIIIGIIVILWLILIYNGLVRRKYRVKESWADIDVQLKRRYDLIPNLIETVKGYAAHEKEAFEKVTQARAAALGAQTVHDKEAAENTLSSALKSIFAIAEAYPQLRAVESFTNLQNELSDTENKIQAARRFYNGNVMELNTKIETFPTNLFAWIFGFKKEEFFQLQQEEAKEPVSVKF